MCRPVFILREQLPFIDYATLTFIFFLRCLEDRVKSQKSPQVEKGEEAMGKGREAKHGGNAMMPQR